VLGWLCHECLSNQEKNEVIYIGQSNNLQEKFAKYLDMDFEDSIYKQKTVAYQREFLDNPKERQSQLLEEFKDRFWRLPRCNEKMDWKATSLNFEKDDYYPKILLVISTFLGK